jgi:hypothetical protein
LPLICGLLLCLSGCFAAPRQGERFTAAVLKTVTLEELLPNPRDMLYNALLQGVNVAEVRQRRLMGVSCANAPGPGNYSTLYLALAPPGMDDLALWDPVEARKGVRTGEIGPLTAILRRGGPPGPAEQTTVLGRREVLCREDPATQVIHAKVDFFIRPYEMLRVQLQGRDPLRGLDEAEVRAGRIVRVHCALAEETDGFIWYARVPEGVDLSPDAADPAAGDPIVEVRAGRPEANWQGGHIGSMSRLTRESEDAAAREHWPIELSTVIRRLPAPPAGYVRGRVPHCGGAANP